MDECGILKLVSDATPGPVQPRRRGKSLMNLFWMVDLTQKPLRRDVLI